MSEIEHGAIPKNSDVEKLKAVNDKLDVEGVKLTGRKGWMNAKQREEYLKNELSGENKRMADLAEKERKVQEFRHAGKNV